MGTVVPGPQEVGQGGSDHVYRLTQNCPRGSKTWELPVPDRRRFRTLSMLCEPVTPDFLTHSSRAQGSRKRRSLSQSPSLQGGCWRKGGRDPD